MSRETGPARAGTFDVEGLVVVVTGGSRGIGRAIAEEFVRNGAKVVISGRNADRLREAAGEIGGEIAWHAGSVAEESEVEALADCAAQRFGRVDVLVNNAGINPYFRRSEDTTLGEWSDVIDVNLTGVFLCCRAFGRRMLAARGGSIVNVTSVAAHVGLSRSAAYGAAKAGVEAMSRTFALDWARGGVRVNCLAPGYVATDLTAGMRENEGLRKGLEDKTPLGRIADAREIAGTAVFLASPAASYITGQAILVDGGWTAV